MPIFGARNEFAIEIAVDAGAVLSPRLVNQVLGRARVWCAGHELGIFDEPLCWIGPVVGEFERVLAGIEKRYDERFDSLTPEERFTLLDRIEFDPENESLPDPEPLGFVAHFLTNCSEAFDDVKAFLVIDAADEVEILWQRWLSDVRQPIRSTTLPIATFRDVVNQFIAWYGREERSQAEQRAAVWPVSLIARLRPKMRRRSYAFVQLADDDDLGDLRPEITVRESEGLTVVIEADEARARGLEFFHCAWITLTVESELEAVGLTAVVAALLADEDIPCNVVAGVSHDHLFVPAKDGKRAVEALKGLSEDVERSLRSER